MFNCLERHDTKHNFRSLKYRKKKNTLENSITKWVGLEGDFLLRSAEDKKDSG